MKKLIFLFAAVLFTAISSNLLAQNSGTGTSPAIGDVHNYSVAPGTPNGNTYTWSLTTDIGGTTPVAGTVATLSSSGGVDISDIDITWVGPAMGTTYYLHVTDADLDGNGCSNHKALAITPNLFELEIENVDLADGDTPNVNDFEICPANVDVTAYTGANDGTLAEAQEFTYDYDRDSVFYKVIASGIDLTTTGWSPQFTIGHDGIGGTVVTAEWATAIGGTYTTGLLTDGSTNDIDVTTGMTTSGEIWIKVVVDNGDNLTGNEGITANNVLVTLLDGADESEDENGNDVTDINNGDRKQIVKARPATIDIITTE